MIHEIPRTIGENELIAGQPTALEVDRIRYGNIPGLLGMLEVARLFDWVTELEEELALSGVDPPAGSSKRSREEIENELTIANARLRQFLDSAKDGQGNHPS